MTVHNGKDANYTNVYQKNTAVSSLTASQKFRLEQVSSKAVTFSALCAVQTAQIGLLIFREWGQSQPLESWISNIRKLQSQETIWINLVLVSTLIRN